MNAADEREYYRITPLNSNFRVLKDDIYICASNYNGLFKADVVNGTLKFITKFECQNCLDMNLFLMESVENTLVFLPIFANEIALYDLEAGELCEIPLSNIYTKDITNTSNIAICDDKVWIFPTKGRYMTELDYKNKRIGSVIDIYDIYQNFFNMGYRILGVNGSYVYEDTVIIAYWEKPYMIEFYPKNKTFRFVKVQECNLGFCALYGEGENIYALNDDGYIYVWNIKRGEVVKKIYTGEEAKRQNNKFYRKIHIYNERIYLFPFSEITQMKTIDLKLGAIDKKLPQWLQSKNSDLFFGYADKNKMYLYSNENHVMCVDLEKQCMDWGVDIQYDDAELKKIIVDDKNKVQSGLIKESRAFLVKDLLRFTTVSDGKETENIFSRGDIIHNAIMYE